MLFKFSGQNFAEGFGILKKFQREFRTEIRTEFRSKKPPFQNLFYFSGSLSNQTARPQAVFQGQLWIDKKKWKTTKVKEKAKIYQIFV